VGSGTVLTYPNLLLPRQIHGSLKRKGAFTLVKSLKNWRFLFSRFVWGFEKAGAFCVVCDFHL
jgi:hypothetical protein